MPDGTVPIAPASIDGDVEAGDADIASADLPAFLTDDRAGRRRAQRRRRLTRIFGTEDRAPAGARSSRFHASANNSTKKHRETAMNDTT